MNYNSHVSHWPPQRRNTRKNRHFSQENQSFHSNYSQNFHGYHGIPTWIHPGEQWHQNCGIPRPNFIYQRGHIVDDPFFHFQNNQQSNIVQGSYSERYNSNYQVHQPSQSTQNDQLPENTVVNTIKKLNYTKSIQFSKSIEAEGSHTFNDKRDGPIDLQDEGDNKNETTCKMESQSSSSKTTYTLEDVQKESSKLHSANVPARNNKHTKRLIEGLSQPVQAGVAERMMQRMGWTGGSLGARGDGIQEPIMPNLFMVDKKGFGAPEPEENTAKPPHKNSNSHNNYENTAKPSYNFAKRSTRLKNYEKYIPTEITDDQFNDLLAEMDEEDDDSDFFFDPEETIPKQKKPFNKKNKNQQHNQINQSKKITQQNRKQKKSQPTMTVPPQRGTKITGHKSKKRARKNAAKYTTQRIALKEILEFVRDENLDSMEFNKDCTKSERASIHQLVAMIRGEAFEDFEDYQFCEENAEVIAEIRESGCGLYSESVGKFPSRTLHLFKEVPTHIYFITANDLRYDEEEEGYENIIKIDTAQDENNTKSEIDNKANETEKGAISEEISFGEKAETNDSTSTSDQKPPEKENINEVFETETQESNKDDIYLDYVEVRDLLFTYLKEFYDNEVYTEMKFKGSFNKTEIKAIDDFSNDIIKCTDLAEYCHKIPEIEKNGLSEYLRNSKLNIEIDAAHKYVHKGPTMKRFKKNTHSERLLRMTQ
ncbi:hypothetical protein JYU34_001177 [Plutella xylostella]|uniref:G-patch domain-containing protein n=1 Tax=Plutella xylostella TaxID=51655 RepID=A0ABQ7R670_PLUXY|nr:hypothetical protein JYU34_001177 [Plutella xylostella]